MRLADTIALSKADEIAMKMQESGASSEHIDAITGIRPNKLERLRAPATKITRPLITAMLAEAYDMAESSNEVVAVAKELGKLHGLYEPEKTVTLNVDSGDITKQLSQMSTEELQRLLGTPTEQIVIEGECSAD